MWELCSGLPGYFSVKSTVKDFRDRREIDGKSGRTEAGTKDLNTCRGLMHALEGHRYQIKLLYS